MKITQKDIDQAYLDHHVSCGGTKEDYFALLFLVRKFKLPFEEAAAQIAFGGNDYGFDAFHFDREARNLYLYQFKWSENPALFKQSFTRLIEDGMEAVFGSPADPFENPVLVQLRATIHANQALIDRVFVQFIFNGQTVAAEQLAVLAALREDLENKKYLVHQNLGRDAVDFKVQYLSNSDPRIGGHGPDEPTYSFEIEFNSPLTTSTSGGFAMHVGFTTLSDLARIHGTMGDYLFERNIRSGLSLEKPANRAIKNALRDVVLNGHNPDTFVFNHNGITMSVERLEPVSDTHVRVVEPRILNGAQTITTLSRFIGDSSDNEIFKKNKSKLSATHVLSRIVCANSQQFITQVTICNNRQNPVNAWNLRASDYIQLEFEDRFREIGVFYERQEGAFDAFLKLSPVERQARGIYENKPIKIRPLAHTFLACQGEIGMFSRISEVFESEKIYANTFKESYLSIDPHRILLAYKVQFPLGRVVKNVIEAAAAKFEILRRAKNLIWALLFQAVWNHPKFPDWLESYGTSMVVEFAFVDVLNSLAAGKVKSIISEGLKRPHNEAKLASEDFGFLRGSGFYKECMDIASDKYGWKKCGLATALPAKS